MIGLAAKVDGELVRMFRAKEVNLTLHEDRGRLTQADRTRRFGSAWTTCT